MRGYHVKRGHFTTEFAVGLIFQRAYFCEEKAKRNCYWDFSVDMYHVREFFSTFIYCVLFTLDLILNAVYPFRSADYGSYQSAGFRGQLGKGFHTINGLTHVFVHGVPMETVPDIE